MFAIPVAWNAMIVELAWLKGKVMGCVFIGVRRLLVF